LLQTDQAFGAKGGGQQTICLDRRNVGYGHLSIPEVDDRRQIEKQLGLIAGLQQDNTKAALMKGGLDYEIEWTATALGHAVFFSAFWRRAVVALRFR